VHQETPPRYRLRPREKGQPVARSAGIQTATVRSTENRAQRGPARMQRPGPTRRWFHEGQERASRHRMFRTRSVQIGFAEFDCLTAPPPEPWPSLDDMPSTRIRRLPITRIARTTVSTPYSPIGATRLPVFPTRRQDESPGDDASLADDCGKIGSECGIFARRQHGFAGRRART
jgi:hypothetical protein